jgi:transposase-like protein
LAAALKLVYEAANAAMAAAATDESEAGPWGKKFPTVAAMWRRQWQQVIPLFADTREVLTIIYTTNAKVAQGRRCLQCLYIVGSIVVAHRHNLQRGVRIFVEWVEDILTPALDL